MSTRKGPDYKALYEYYRKSYDNGLASWQKERQESENEDIEAQDQLFRALDQVRSLEKQLADRDAKIAALMACVRGLFGTVS